MKYVPWLFSFFSLCLSAKIVDYQTTGLVRARYGYKEVCQKHGLKHNVLVKALDLNHLECMGRKLNVSEFCLKQAKTLKERPFLRAKVSRVDQKVYCDYGHQAFVSLACDSRHGHICEQKQKRCKKLKNIFAYDLKILREAELMEDGDKRLNCYFSQKMDQGPQILIDESTRL